MRIESLKRAGAGVLLAAAAACAAAADRQPAAKLPFDPAPSAELTYALAARQAGFSLSGKAVIVWRAGEGKYVTIAESRVQLLGKITENRSQGAIDGFGLAPEEFHEKRFRKDPTSATFDRGSKTLSFSEGKQTYSLVGGEQDRASVTWQLVGQARAAGDKFRPGSTWPFFVAGRRDADPWTFRVVKQEKVQTAMGEIDAMHVTREPVAGARDQTLDIWLAPSQQWYPVKLRFTDDGQDFVEQTLEKVVRK